MKEGIKVIIDLQFFDLMTEKEQNSLIKQLGYCHSVNRKLEKAFNYILTSATSIALFNKNNVKVYLHRDTMLTNGALICNRSH
jgi:Trm5-related predicted tRNA methylase